MGYEPCMVNSVRTNANKGRFVARLVIGVTAYALLILGSIRCLKKNAFLSFSGIEQFENKSGMTAKTEFEIYWPQNIDPLQIESVSYKREWSRDSYSIWFRIVAEQETAAIWANDAHRQHAKAMGIHSEHYIQEGITRILQGMIPLHGQTGVPPSWWDPSIGVVRATEIMDWYTVNASGYGSGTYTNYDEKTGVLWIYKYSAQHSKLWERGSPPHGDILPMQVNDSSTMINDYKHEN